ncbi:MAG TPA: metal-sulfur cluster assembly factor [Clostridia bacterium]|nr:metal-sulfur cluster assembly factor [Clostridia bacterium]
MVTNEEVMTALKDCYDPEIPVNLVDLGLIYDVRLKPTALPGSDGQDVEVDMTLTAPGCPAHTMISEQVRHRLLSLPGIKDANVNVVWSPPWTPERLSDAAKKQLGIE